MRREAIAVLNEFGINGANTQPWLEDVEEKCTERQRKTENAQRFYSNLGRGEARMEEGKEIQQQVKDYTFF